MVKPKRRQGKARHADEAAPRESGELDDPADLLPAPLDSAALPVSQRGDPSTYVAPSDTFRHYLQQVSRYPRLTREEEVDLARRYREYGDPEAAYRLVTGNLRLVVRIAFDYRRNFLNLLDLVQEGNLGLMHAVRKFDPLREVPFSAYAGWWIRAYVIKHLLDHWSIVRVGTTNARRRLFFNLKKERERLEREGIDFGPKLLAERFDTTEQDVVDVSKALHSRDLSLDAPVSADSERSVWETIPAAQVGADETVAQQQLREILKEKIAAFAVGLKEKERYVLEQRLTAEDPVTLQAIGDHFGMTREAARQIEAKVIVRLRAYLREALGDLSAFEVADDPEREPESPAAAERRKGRS